MQHEAGKGQKRRSRRHAQQQAQIMGGGLETARPQPTLRLLVDRLPVWEVMRRHAPLRVGSHQPTQAVIDLAQVALALQGVFAHQRQIRRDEHPLVVAHIRGIGLACTHAAFYPAPTFSS